MLSVYNKEIMKMLQRAEYEQLLDTHVLLRRLRFREYGAEWCLNMTEN